MNSLFRKGWAAFVLSSLVLVIIGCSPFSADVKKESRNQPSFGAIRSRPASYRGRLVLLGGTILYGKHRDHATYFEVLAKDLNAYDRPIASDKADGRFVVGVPSHLDLSTYSKGREITVVGRVVGPQPGRIGERAYTYPLIAATRIHLWREYVPRNDYWTYPRMEVVWGYPGMDWGTAWPNMPPLSYW